MRRFKIPLIAMISLTGSICLAIPFANSQEEVKDSPRQLISSPCKFPEGIQGEQGLLVVPENRARENSREIVVSYIRFRTKSREKRNPVFVLPGGPGEPYTEARIRSWFPTDQKFGLMTEIVEYLKDRDVVMINQRGNPRATGLWSREFVMFAEPGEMDTAHQKDQAIERLRVGAKQSLEDWQKQGIDLSGYCIINLVDDIDDLRRALGYSKVCLRGSSFGSQSSLAYLERYPQFVSRAILHGVEPLDHTYDDPEGIWNLYQRLDKMAKGQEELQLPEGGMIGVIKTLITRLESSPVTVRSRHPNRDLWMDVTLGADDLRMYLSDSGFGQTRRESLEYWPAYLMEMYRGDFRYLASRVIDDRPESYQGIIMGHLIDNSLGISPARDTRLNNSTAARWLGDINWRYKATRPVTPTPQVPNEFRTFKQVSVPILMIQGNLDASTPYENATELLPFLGNSHLITIDGGTHGTVRDATRYHPKFPQHLYRFMANDFGTTSPKELYSTMPDRVELPELRFKNPERSLFELLIDEKNN